MSGSTARSSRGALSRRRMLKVLGAVGVTGPLAAELAAQSRERVSADALKRASTLLGEDFSPERLAVVEKALQRNLDSFQLVRDLAIDDSIEPAPIFKAKPRAARAAGASARTRS
jgi:hypothetical protein